MTKQHPLTKEMCDNIAPWPIKRLPGEYTSMRAIADWQLEQVIDWLQNNLDLSMYLMPVWVDQYEINVHRVVADLTKTMRSGRPMSHPLTAGEACRSLKEILERNIDIDPRARKMIMESFEESLRPQQQENN